MTQAPPDKTSGLHLFARDKKLAQYDLTDPNEDNDPAWDKALFKKALEENGLEHVRRTLAELYIEWRAESFGLSRFFNRVSFMANRPLIFIAYHYDTEKKEQGSVGLLDDQVLLFDPLFRDEMLHQLYEAGVLVQADDIPSINSTLIEGYRINRNTTTYFEFRMFSTDSYFFVCAPCLTNNVPGSGPKASEINFLPVRVTSRLGRFLNACFKPLDGEDGRMDIENSYFTKSIRDHAENNQRQKATLECPEALLASPYKSTLDEYSGRLEALIEAERDNVAKAVLFRSQFERTRPARGVLSKNTVPEGCSELIWNLWTFVKKFTRDNSRFDEYHYDPAVILGGERSQAMLNTLAHVQRIDPDLKNWIAFGEDTYWRKSSTGDDTPEYNESEWAKAETWFRSCLHGGGAKHKEIINVLASPVPRCVRFFGESAMLSGVTIVTPSAFAKGNIGWLANQYQPRVYMGENTWGWGRAEKIDILEQRDGARWLICLHYFMQFGAGQPIHLNPITQEREKQLDLSIVSIPLRVGGAPWCVASHVRSGLVDEQTGLVVHSTYQQQFLVYHSMFRAFEARLRRKAKDLYLKLIFETMTEVVTPRISKGELRLEKDDILLFNTLAHGLCRVWPFRRIELQSEDGETIRLLRQVVVRLYPNPFFDRLKLREFIQQEEAETAVRGAILQAIGDDQNARNESTLTDSPTQTN